MTDARPIHPAHCQCDRCRPATRNRQRLPRTARAVLIALIATGLLHIAQQCLGGYVQCRILGCLPW